MTMETVNQQKGDVDQMMEDSSDDNILIDVRMKRRVEKENGILVTRKKTLGHTS